VIARSIAHALELSRPQLIKDPGETALFLNHRGNRLTRQGLWLIIKVCAKKAGLPADVTPHTLRHSFATHQISRGTGLREVQLVLVKKQLGGFVTALPVNHH
jgi:integrase/recombinase XerD